MRSRLEFLTTPAARRFFRGAGILCLVTIAGLSLQPLGPHSPKGVHGPVQHFIAYLGTGAIWSLALFSCVSRARAVIWLIAYAGLMELLQNFAAGRHPQFLDAVVSGAGAVVGVAFVVLFSRLIRLHSSA